MPKRTTLANITFSSPFILGGMDEELPAGAYQVETEEELLEGVTFPAYRRTLTILHIQGKAGEAVLARSVNVDPKELEMAIERDNAGAASVDPGTGSPRPDVPTESDSMAAEMEKYGITRRPVDYFHYRDFRYTILADAIAEAIRDQSAR